MTMYTSSFRSSMTRLAVSRQALYSNGGVCSSTGQSYQKYNQIQNLSVVLLQRKQQDLNHYSTTTVFSKDLPYHIVVGLPALSPTMENGTLSEWYVKEGDSFAAGDGIAKIETDKAAMDFEAQDDGFVAKILIQAGQGSDLAVGTPIMITVEDGNDVAAFKDYVHQVETVTAAVATPTVAVIPPPPVQTKTDVVAPTPAVVPVSSPPTPTPVVASSSPPAPVTFETIPLSTSFSTAYGLSVSKTSPIAKTLGAQQSAYIAKYGTTGQVPVL